MRSCSSLIYVSSICESTQIPFLRPWCPISLRARKLCCGHLSFRRDIWLAGTTHWICLNFVGQDKMPLLRNRASLCLPHSHRFAVLSRLKNRKRDLERVQSLLGFYQKLFAALYRIDKILQFQLQWLIFLYRVIDQFALTYVSPEKYVFEKIAAGRHIYGIWILVELKYLLVIIATQHA